jgi:uncharacterized protein (TIGR03083 family)
MRASDCGRGGDLAAWVVGACSVEEAAAMGEHVRGCPRCVADHDLFDRTAGWLGVVTAMRPPASLRSRVLTEARARRWNRHRLRTEVIDPYLLQVRTLDALLGDLTPAQWHTPVPRHGDVTGLVRHLAGNDAMVLADLEPLTLVAPAGGPAAEPGSDAPVAHEQWRAQSSSLVAHLGNRSPRELERPVRLAGRSPVHRSVREGMVQRAFETWIHADDVRTSLRLVGPPPPSRHLRSIVDLAVALLPGAMIAAGRGRSGEVARLRLSEAAEETEWRMLLGDGDPDADAAVTIHTDMAAFCRLVAGRRARHDLVLRVTGEEALAVDLLDVASTLGCD